MLSETEFLCACVAQKGAAYPQEELEEIWKEVLLYQFHDILPGSSIRRVYDESVARYCVLEERLTSLSARAAASLGGAPCAANATSFEREEYVKHGGKWYAVSAQPYSAAELGAEAKAVPPFAAADGLENEFVRVRFGENGEVLSLYDKTLGTETLQKPSNLLRVYNDVWDAWDFSPEYAMTEGEAFRLRSAEPFTDGPIAGVRQVYVYGDSLKDDVFKDKVGRISVKEIIRSAKDRRAGSLGYAEALLLYYNKKMKSPLKLEYLYSRKPPQNISLTSEVPMEDYENEESEDDPESSQLELFQS